jgi:beta-lactam-binding protein with PASTA domain
LSLTDRVNISSSHFPDLTGMSARQALGVLARLGFTAQLRGAGLVVDQVPPPGTPLDSDVTVVLRLERRHDVVANAEAP